MALCGLEETQTNKQTNKQTRVLIGPPEEYVHGHTLPIMLTQIIIGYRSFTKRDAIPNIFAKRDAQTFLSQKGMPMVIFFTKRDAKRPFGV